MQVAGLTKVFGHIPDELVAEDHQKLLLRQPTKRFAINTVQERSECSRGDRRNLLARGMNRIRRCGVTRLGGCAGMESGAAWVRERSVRQF